MATLIHDAKIQEYCKKYSSSQHPILSQIENYNKTHTRSPEDGSDFIQGSFLRMVSQMLNPSLIVELGAFTGYSTICLAQGLAKKGKMITIEGKAHLEPVIRKHLDEAGVSDQVDIRIGQAQEILPAIEGPIDLIFMDANKRRYFVFFEMIVEKLRPGGFLIADNTLWKGTIVKKDKDKMAQAVHDFNRLIKKDDRVEKLILPIRDGLTLIRKI